MLFRWRVDDERASRERVESKQCGCRAFENLLGESGAACRVCMCVCVHVPVCMSTVLWMCVWVCFDLFANHCSQKGVGKVKLFLCCEKTTCFFETPHCIFCIAVNNSQASGWFCCNTFYFSSLNSIDTHYCDTSGSLDVFAKHNMQMYFFILNLRSNISHMHILFCWLKMKLELILWGYNGHD